MRVSYKYELTGLAMLAVSGFVSAQTSSSCSEVLHFYSTSPPSVQSEFLSNHPECFAGSATTSQVQINSTTVQQISAISAALSSRFSVTSPNQQAMAGIKSMAAGGQKDQRNAWASLNNNDTEQNYTSATNNNVSNKNAILTTVLGADYALSPQMVVGVSAAFDSGTGSGLTGANTIGNQVSSKGYTIAPYLGMQINKELALDASVGFGKGEVEVSTTGFSPAIAQSSRSFLAVNLSYNRWMDRVQLSGKAGLLHAAEDYADSTVGGMTQAGTAAKNTLDQLRLGVQAGYWMDGFMPYVGLAYTSDMNRSTTQSGAGNDPIGKQAWVWSLGVNVFASNGGVTGGLVYSQETARSNQKSNNLVANVNIRF